MSNTPKELFGLVPQGLSFAITGFPKWRGQAETAGKASRRPNTPEAGAYTAEALWKKAVNWSRNSLGVSVLEAWTLLFSNSPGWKDSFPQGWQPFLKLGKAMGSGLSQDLPHKFPGHVCGAQDINP